MRGHRRIWFGAAVIGAVVALIAGAFLIGRGSVDEHGAEIAALTGKLHHAENEEETWKASSETAATLAEASEEEAHNARSQLHAERSMNGKTSVVQTSKYNTDFEWDTAGTVGYLTIKPVFLEHQGDDWLLTVEAKNEGSEPTQPFCGDAGAALLDDAGRTFTGEPVLEHGSMSCSNELEPGLTLTYISKFKLPSGSNPVAAAIYGDYEQEAEAKTWALPEVE